MVLTLAHIPRELDDALRLRAQSEGKSIDEVALEALRTGLGLAIGTQKRRDLSEFAGTWVEDPEVDAALRDQDRVDPELWRSTSPTCPT
jgi:hypothetical protein